MKGNIFEQMKSGIVRSVVLRKERGDHPFEIIQYLEKMRVELKKIQIKKSNGGV